MKQNYIDRMMRARDSRFAKIAEKMGYGRRDMVAAPPPVDEMAALREEYIRVVGKRPFMGWDAAKLRARLAMARGAD
jgi:hypothetical protein